MTPRTRVTERTWSSEAGSELVEFAIASSLFFLTVFGLFQAGLTIWRYNTLATLAQDGARYAAVRGSGADATMRSTGTETAVRDYVRTRAFGWNPTVSVSPTNPNTAAAGTVVTVTVSVPMVRFGSFIPWSGTMTASSSMSIVR